MVKFHYRSYSSSNLSFAKTDTVSRLLSTCPTQGRSFGLNIGAAKWGDFWKNWVLLHFYVTISKYWYGSSRVVAPGAMPLLASTIFVCFAWNTVYLDFLYVHFVNYRWGWWKWTVIKKSITHHAPEHCRLTISAFTYKESLIKDCTKGAVLDVIYILLRLRFRKSFCNSKKINLGIKTQEKKVFHTGLKVILSC